MALKDHKVFVGGIGKEWTNEKGVRRERERGREGEKEGGREGVVKM